MARAGDRIPGMLRVTATGSLLVVGIAITLAMLVVTCTLAARITSSEMDLHPTRMLAGGGAATPAVPSSASAEAQLAGKGPLEPPPTAAGPVKSLAEGAATAESANNTIVNAMTAVATAIAAVTLILSIGTTWFAAKLKEVETASNDLRRKDMEYERRLEEIRTRQDRHDRAQRQLIDAKMALRQWVDASSKAGGRYSMLADLTAQVEMLMSSSPDGRLAAFAVLTKVLPPHPRPLLLPLEVFSMTCHDLHGGRSNTHGVWCSIFDPVERTAFAQASRHVGPQY